MANHSGIRIDSLHPIVRVELPADADEYAALASALRRAADAPGCRAILIAGAWDSAPANLPLNAENDPVAALAAIPLPTVAWIDGLCAEENLELALAADIRVASPRAEFRMAHAAQGRLPTHGGAARLVRLAGLGCAMRLLLAGETLPNHDALRDGLAQATGPLDAALALANAAASAAPIATRYAKEAIHAAADLPLAEGLRLEADLSLLLHSTSDRAEGIRSFAERRPPRYKGQ